jgi:hypothetical protein
MNIVRSLVLSCAALSVWASPLAHAGGKARVIDTGEKHTVTYLLSGDRGSTKVKYLGGGKGNRIVTHTRFDGGKETKRETVYTNGQVVKDQMEYVPFSSQGTYLPLGYRMVDLLKK